MDNMSRDFAELFFTNISVNKISNACNSNAQDASKCMSGKMIPADACGDCVRFIYQLLSPFILTVLISSYKGALYTSVI